jgi:hypothetical protein
VREWCLEFLFIRLLVFSKEASRTVRETLKPNLSGNSAKSRSSRVPLPTPDGPESTRGGNIGGGGKGDYIFSQGGINKYIKYCSHGGVARK